MTHLLVIRPYPQSWAACEAGGDKSLVSHLPWVECPACQLWEADDRAAVKKVSA